MTAWMFPAGDPSEREAVAIHRLTNPDRDQAYDRNRRRRTGDTYDLVGFATVVNALSSTRCAAPSGHMRRSGRRPQHVWGSRTPTPTSFGAHQAA